MMPTPPTPFVAPEGEAAAPPTGTSNCLTSSMPRSSGLTLPPWIKPPALLVIVELVAMMPAPPLPD